MNLNRLTLEQKNKYNALPDDVKDMITDKIIANSMDEELSHSFLVNALGYTFVKKEK